MPLNILQLEDMQVEVLSDLVGINIDLYIETQRECCMAEIATQTDMEEVRALIENYDQLIACARSVADLFNPEAKGA